jgi:beta-1,2-mannosidase
MSGARKAWLATAALGPAWVIAASAPGWQIGPFVRPAGIGPLIIANLASVFRNPVDGKPVHWEALHTFNPATVVRNGKVYILYRAEDDTVEKGIGLHTSRLGLAESDDGIQFVRRPKP